MKKDLSEKEITIFQFLFIDKDTSSIEDYLLNTNSLLDLSQDEIDELNDLAQYKKSDYTKNQHYVQKGYLKKFTNADTWKLITLDLKAKKRLNKEQSVKRVCSDTYFYSVKDWERDVLSQIVERYLWKYEDHFINQYDGFVQQIMSWSKIDEELVYDICTYLSISWMRTKRFRDETFRSIDRQLTEHLGKWWWDIDKIKEENGLWEDKINIQHVMMLLDEKSVRGYANLFFAQRIKIFYINELDSHFVTSDNPVISIHPRNKESFYWIPFLQRIHYFALSPKILIEFSEHTWGKHIQRKQLKTNEEVTYYNSLRSMFSSYLYSDNEFSLEEELYSIVRANYIDELYSLFWDHSWFQKDIDGINELKKKYWKRKFKSNYDMLQYELETLKHSSQKLLTDLLWMKK